MNYNNISEYKIRISTRYQNNFSIRQHCICRLTRNIKCTQQAKYVLSVLHRLRNLSLSELEMCLCVWNLGFERTKLHLPWECSSVPFFLERSANLYNTYISIIYCENVEYKQNVKKLITMEEGRVRFSKYFITTAFICILVRCFGF